MRKDMKIMNSFFKQRDSHRFTSYIWNSTTDKFDQKSVIDYIISSDRRIVQNVKVLPGVSMDSDHRLLVADLRKKAERLQAGEKRSVIKMEVLKKKRKRQEYEERLNVN